MMTKTKKTEPEVWAIVCKSGEIHVEDEMALVFPKKEPIVNMLSSMWDGDYDCGPHQVMHFVRAKKIRDIKHGLPALVKVLKAALKEAFCPECRFHYGEVRPPTVRCFKCDRFRKLTE